MPTQGHFPTPMYWDQVHGEKFKAIQNELFLTYQKLKFSRQKGWGKDTHYLSEDPFTRDILTDMDCKLFLNFLDKSLNNYLDQIGFQFERKYHITQSWFTKTCKGQYAHRHDHGANDIAGVYYLQTNERDGNIYFQTPLQLLTPNFIYGCINGDQQIQAKEGLIGLWPGVLEHGTYTNTTDHERISISFNIQYER